MPHVPVRAASHHTLAPLSTRTFTTRARYAFSRKVKNTMQKESTSPTAPKICNQPGPSDHPNLTASRGIKISQTTKSGMIAATNTLSQSGCPLCIGADNRSAKSSGSWRPNQRVIAKANPKKIAMNTHPAGQRTVPAETKSSAANTAHSAARAKIPFATSALRFITCLHENCTQTKSTANLKLPRIHLLGTSVNKGIEKGLGIEVTEGI